MPKPHIPKPDTLGAKSYDYTKQHDNGFVFEEDWGLSKRRVANRKNYLKRK